MTALGALWDELWTEVWAPRGARNLAEIRADIEAEARREGGWRLPDDEVLGDALHATIHPAHPWSGCSNPDLVYVWCDRFRALLAAEDSQ